MIKLLKQTTEYYCSSEEEAQKVIKERQEKSLGEIVKRNIENKDMHIKLTILKPKEPNPVAYDWQGEALYEDDKVYSTDHGLVLVEEVETFMKDLYDPPFELCVS